MEDKLSVIAKNSSPNASPVQLSVVSCQLQKNIFLPCSLLPAPCSLPLAPCLLLLASCSLPLAYCLLPLAYSSSFI
ncbi:hypothetical protein [Dolichospermum sp. UHCC 0315A]|uniref:hypothetical protein n=1 Tax=Dolichospermum sp. UHCC 0315A TaxID=1914871 RepID=UPI0011E6107B|nr:hypothetical protein [Dolichospermum sp. UHCC 0315A]